ncbi:PRC-barrel domain-containing protein [Novosphingobium sp. SG720]|uniref:PRC-barrel domain-containing protein n=1 Tax=Novosphingobium sp. SG720 TaxID=2586998 RepID=UPI001444E1FA|nr:PRC-barrel domain-containing protein [Novosphingobium sp. SG720]NKJ42166.1 sporulation protein YlmC with PRC-barrel domain [Novosphingobium sp. SG720]
MALDAQPLAAPAGAIALISADDLRGKTVHGRDGDKLGTIAKLVLDERSGQIAYIILSTGGFLGLGQSYHAVPWSAFQYDDGQSGYVTAIDKRLLEGAPSFRPDSAPLFDDAYGRRVTDYYRAPPADIVAF